MNKKRIILTSDQKKQLFYLRKLQLKVKLTRTIGSKGSESIDSRYEEKLKFAINQVSQGLAMPLSLKEYQKVIQYKDTIFENNVESGKIESEVSDDK